MEAELWQHCTYVARRMHHQKVENFSFFFLSCQYPFILQELASEIQVRVIVPCSYSTDHGKHDYVDALATPEEWAIILNSAIQVSINAINPWWFLILTRKNG